MAYQMRRTQSEINFLKKMIHSLPNKKQPQSKLILHFLKKILYIFRSLRHLSKVGEFFPLSTGSKVSIGYKLYLSLKLMKKKTNLIYIDPRPSYTNFLKSRVFSFLTVSEGWSQCWCASWKFRSCVY